LVAGSKDGLFFAYKLVLRGDVSNCGVEAHGVLELDVFGDDRGGLLDIERDNGPNAVGFEQLVLSNLCQRLTLPLEWGDRKGYYLMS